MKESTKELIMRIHFENLQRASLIEDESLFNQGEPIYDHQLHEMIEEARIVEAFLDNYEQCRSVAVDELSEESDPRPLKDRLCKRIGDVFVESIVVPS